MTIRDAIDALWAITVEHADVPNIGDLPLVHICAFCRGASESDLFEVLPDDSCVELHDEPTTRFLNQKSPQKEAVAMSNPVVITAADSSGVVVVSGTNYLNFRCESKEQLLATLRTFTREDWGLLTVAIYCPDKTGEMHRLMWEDIQPHNQ